MSAVVFVVKWHPQWSTPFLGPSTARYLLAPAGRDDLCGLTAEPRRASIFRTRQAAEAARDLARHDLSYFKFGCDPVTRCDPGYLTVVPTTRPALARQSQDRTHHQRGKALADLARGE